MLAPRVFKTVIYTLASVAREHYKAQFIGRFSGESGRRFRLNLQFCVETTLELLWNGTLDPVVLVHIAAGVAVDVDIHVARFAGGKHNGFGVGAVNPEPDLLALVDCRGRKVAFNADFDAVAAGQLQPRDGGVHVDLDSPARHDGERYNLLWDGEYHVFAFAHLNGLSAGDTRQVKSGLALAIRSRRDQRLSLSDLGDYGRAASPAVVPGLGAFLGIHDADGGVDKEPHAQTDDDKSDNGDLQGVLADARGPGVGGLVVLGWLRLVRFGNDGLAVCHLRAFNLAFHVVARLPGGTASDGHVAAGVVLHKITLSGSDGTDVTINLVGVGVRLYEGLIAVILEFVLSLQECDVRVKAVLVVGLKQRKLIVNFAGLVVGLKQRKLIVDVAGLVVHAEEALVASQLEQAHVVKAFLAEGVVDVAIVALFVAPVELALNEVAVRVGVELPHAGIGALQVTDVCAHIGHTNGAERDGEQRHQVLHRFIAWHSHVLRSAAVLFDNVVRAHSAH
ncbi:acetyl-coenzyme A synthetase [Babesia caballi]|uniref:Acetyl-coenzyme A synthetase n=1 Tax=Babesia caballi TaxID=5871 RepID=A0AAV4LV01_BABCB|nr:acetyl-coenzyme A synthetase [Babesia caballi]